jgi:signal transduction histidine kinase
LALSLCVSALAGALWARGALSPLETVFMPGDISSLPAPPQAWAAWLLILAAGLGVGFATERGGGGRALRLVAPALIALCGVSLAASWWLRLNTLFAPMLLAVLGTLAVAQMRRLWIVDAALTRNMKRVAAQVSTLESGPANARLESGLKLLDTVLALDDAVIFRLMGEHHLAPAARLRAGAPHVSGEHVINRNHDWRAGVALCERAISSGEMIVEHGDAHANGNGARTIVALPLIHDGRAVGALLARLREDFDEHDRPLLLNVSAQIARNLQREDARARRTPKERESLFSVSAARQRLEAFGVISGALTEQGFAARVLAESTDGHAVARLDGALAGVNNALLDMARLSSLEAQALDLFGLLDRFRAGVFDEPSLAVRRVLQTGEAYERELVFVERNQTLALRIALITDDEEAQREQGASAPAPLGLAVTVRDVTRIKEHEKLKSDMLSLMSHELRTPITSINGFAELLVMDETLPAETREFLAIISNESQRMARMISAFLSVAQLEQKDRQEVWMAPLMLDDLVREAINVYQPVAKKKRIRLVEIDGARLPPVAADRGMITQAVANLVDNAIKYSPERTAVMLSATLEADAVRFTVEDRGYGIPPEDVSRVWEKFYRVARDGRVKEEESTGLGLSFVREAVEQHGGQVSLESEIGHGSKFSFTLPRM